MALNECSGAVVVVEDVAFEPLPKLPPRVSLKPFNLVYLAMGPWKPEINGYGPLFVDSSAVFESRGGLQTKGYPIGWGFN